MSWVCAGGVSSTCGVGERAREAQGSGLAARAPAPPRPSPPRGLRGLEGMVPGRELARWAEEEGHSSEDESKPRGGALIGGHTRLLFKQKGPQGPRVLCRQGNCDRPGRTLPRLSARSFSTVLFCLVCEEAALPSDSEKTRRLGQAGGAHVVFTEKARTSGARDKANPLIAHGGVAFRRGLPCLWGRPLF